MVSTKRITKFLSIVLLFTIISSIFSPITVKASPKVKLSKINIEIAQGDSVTIKLNNASSKSVKWSSSNKSVATVNKGKIKAIEPGKATITAKYKNKYYQPYLNGKLKCFMPKTECLVIEAYNGDLLVSIDEQILELKELQKHERFSKDFDKIIEIKEKKKYIPPMSHPWKLASFKKQIQKAHTDHVYA